MKTVERIFRIPNAASSLNIKSVLEIQQEWIECKRWQLMRCTKTDKCVLKQILKRYKVWKIKEIIQID